MKGLWIIIAFPILLFAGVEPAPNTLESSKGYADKGVPILSRTKVQAIDRGLNVRACNVFRDRVTKSYYAGNYFMYDKIEPIGLRDEVFSTISQVIEDPEFKEVQKKSIGKANFYWANYEQLGQNNVPLDHFPKSKYAQRLINLLDHLCQ